MHCSYFYISVKIETEYHLVQKVINFIFFLTLCIFPQGFGSTIRHLLLYIAFFKDYGTDILMTFSQYLVLNSPSNPRTFFEFEHKSKQKLWNKYFWVYSSVSEGWWHKHEEEQICFLPSELLQSWPLTRLGSCNSKQVMAFCQNFLSLICYLFTQRH